jgi:bacillithiol system protein YtxJ
MAKIRAWMQGILLGSGQNITEILGVQEITQLPHFDEVLAASATAPQLVFKHSTTCPISAAAHRQVASYLADRGGDATPVLLVKVIESRPLSNEIAARLGVTHQSPQAILIKDGAAVWNASHGGITAASLKDAVGRA